MFGRINELEMMEIENDACIPMSRFVSPVRNAISPPSSPPKRTHDSFDSEPESPKKIARTSEQQKNSTAIIFKGQSKTQYQKMLEFIRHNDLVNGNFEKLGNVAVAPQFYFEEGEAEPFAKDFLTTLWASEKNVNATEELLRAKFNDEEINKTKQPQAPACISFVSAMISGSKQYFISLSGKENNSKQVALALLEEFIKDYRYENRKIALLGGNIDDFNRLLAYVADNKDTRTIQKPCSEKFIASCLTKLFMEHKDSLVINGLVNCTFYPYATQLEKANSGMVAVPEVYTGKITSGNEVAALKIPCCDACQANKNAVLTILHSASAATQEIQTSPVKRSIRNYGQFSPNSRRTYFGEKPVLKIAKANISKAAPVNDDKINYPSFFLTIHQPEDCYVPHKNNKLSAGAQY
jgi:hypothetical protein